MIKRLLSRAVCRYLMRGRKTLLLKTRFNDGRIHVILPDALSRTVFCFGEYEPWVRQFAQRHLRPGDTVLDVGAHIGLYAAMFSHAVGPSGRVVSFEPIEEKFHVLSLNARLLGNVVAINAALGDRAGLVDINHYGLHHSGLDSIGSALYKPEAGFMGEPPKAEKRTVPILTLDELAAGADHVRLLKVDVEGFEEAVLTGAERTLAKCDMVMLEVHGLDTERGAGLIGYMAARGFAPSVVQPSGELAPIPAGTKSADVVFTRKSSGAA